MSRFRCFPPAMVVSWTGAGSGDGTAADPIDETMYAESIRVPFPSRLYRAAAIGTGVNRYVNGATGSDANDGLSAAAAKATFLAAYDDCVAGDASNKDCINMLAGAVPAGMPVGSVGEYNEGELGTLSKNVIIQAYSAAGVSTSPSVIFDGRPAPFTSFTQQGSQWWTAFTSSFRPALNSGQCGAESTDPTYSPIHARWAVQIKCLAAQIVTKNGTVIEPCATNNVTSITRSSNTATVTTAAAHSLSTGDVVAITNVSDGASYDDYNGVYEVTVTGGTTFTYAVANTPDTPAVAGDGDFSIQWSSRLQATGDTYFPDAVNNRLYIGFDPTGHVVRAATKRTFASFTGAAVVKGIVFRCYSSRYGESGQNYICSFAASQTWENCAAGFTMGDAWRGSGATIPTDCQAFWCRTGWSGSLSSVTLHRCTGRYFNWLPALYGRSGWHCGLGKAVGGAPTGVTYRQCHAEYSNGPIYWFDFAGENNKVLNCRAGYATKYGVSNEKCTGAAATELMVAGCLFEDCYWGLGNLGTKHLFMFNNTVFRCGVLLRVFDDSRSPTHNVEGGTLVVKNNVFVAANGSVLPGMNLRAAFYTADGPTDSTPNASTWFGELDRNVWHIPSDTTWTVDPIQWDTGLSATGYASHVAWETAMDAIPATHGDNDVVSTSTTLTTYLTDPVNGNFTPTANAGNGGTLTAAQVAALGPAYGPAATVAPKKGACFYPGCRG